ncbi:MAG: helix-turn-helix transcriptional regulator [Bacteroidia bacterium]|nr:helix-turn-helix transcriptional regulator [Bacteroidia bacterium]
MEIDISALLIKIKQTRKDKGVSQAQMGESLGLSQKGYADIEAGKVSLRLETFMKILSLLEMENPFKEETLPEKKEQLQLAVKFETLEDLAAYVSNLATKQDMQQMATKQDIEDLKRMIEDLKRGQNKNKNDDSEE